MYTKPIDLHVHSTCSDGTYTPTELISLASDAGLSAIALTDHDSIAGIQEAVQAASHTDIEIIPGVELSCDYDGQEVHMLGLYIRPDDEEFSAKLEEFGRVRESRNKHMVELLAEEGLDITYEKLIAANPDSVITRGNIARYLVENGCVKDRSTVFSKDFSHRGDYVDSSGGRACVSGPSPALPYESRILDRTAYQAES